MRESFVILILKIDISQAEDCQFSQQQQQTCNRSKKHQFGKIKIKYLQGQPKN